MQKTVLLALIFLAFGTCANVSEDERKSQLCASRKHKLTCPEGSTLQITGVELAYINTLCPSNRTVVTGNCTGTYTGGKSQVETWNKQCNGIPICVIQTPGGTTFSGCTGTPVANVYSVSYKCHLGPTTASTDSSTPITPTGNSISASLAVTSTLGTPATASPSRQPFPYTIPLAAGAGGAVLIIIVLILILFCKTRKSGDESIESPKARKESVTEVNINKVGTHRKRTAPRIKEADRPDVTADTFKADVADVSYNPSDPRGLYAVPDKKDQPEDLADDRKEDKTALVPVYSQVRRSPKPGAKTKKEETSFSDISETEQSQTGNVDPPKIYQNTTFKGDPLHQADNDANESIEDGLDNMGFVGDSDQYAEIKFGQPLDSAISEQRRVRFGGEEEIVGKGRESPDGLSDVGEGSTHAANDETSRDKVPSVVYAEVNKKPL